MPETPELCLGPLLRHVGPAHATVWVETSRPCTVSVLGHEQPTFSVAGHHYALVVVRGLSPGTTTPYEVHLDGAQAWPSAPQPHGPAERFPASTIRTPRDDRLGTLRIAFGSCRYACPLATRSTGAFDPCALDALAAELTRSPPEEWPDVLLLLGDQVYADETTPGVRQRIHERRGESLPRHQASDFEEYTWLYAESWSDPEVRWLFSVVPTAMIFDDHDVHDDWNTSRSWRQDLQATSWWSERLTAALASYWVYQHLGNLSPDDLDAEPTYAQVLALGPGTDAEPLLDDLARRADAEAEGAKGHRWSFIRDVGRTRIVVLDSRCGRVLDGEHRGMLGDREFAWAREQLRTQADHVLVASSLPWLIAPGLHDLEAWNERLAGDPRPRRARLGERIRRAGDLEHWAAFGASFRRLTALLAEAARGEDGAPGHQRPATVAVLSGDVHHSYVARARLDPPVYQLTCSPLHNRVPAFMRIGFRLSWSRLAERCVRALLGRVAKVPPPGLSWDLTGGPFFGNMLGMIRIDGRQAELTLSTTHSAGRRDHRRGADSKPQLRVLHRQLLTAPSGGALQR